MSFKENVAHIGNFKFIIDEDKIAESTKLLKLEIDGLKEERLIRRDVGPYYCPYLLMQSWILGFQLNF